MNIFTKRSYHVYLSIFLFLFYTVKQSIAAENNQQRNLSDNSNDIDDAASSNKEYNDNTEEEDDEYSILEDYFAGADEEDPYYYLIRNGILALVCVCVGAIEAGIIYGIASLDEIKLQIKAQTSNSPVERKKAQTLLLFVQRKHLIISSTIIVNMVMNEALPVFLDRVVPTYMSVILSATIVVFVGEILPSAYFIGDHGINALYKLLPVIRATIVLTFCISYPLSRFLDNHIKDFDDKDDDQGESLDEKNHNQQNRNKNKKQLKGKFLREEICAFVRIKHEQERLKAEEEQKRRNGTYTPPQEDIHDFLPDLILPEENEYSFINSCYRKSTSCVTPVAGACIGLGEEDKDEEGSNTVDIDDVENIERTLAFRKKVAKDCMTPLHRTFGVASHRPVNDDFILDVYRYGYSRIPVFDKPHQQEDNDDSNEDTSYSYNFFGIGNIRGVLLAKHLMVVDRTSSQEEGGGGKYRTVASLPLFRPPCIRPNTPISEILSIFRMGGINASQLAIVCENPMVAKAALDAQQAIPIEANVLGIITYDDIVQQALGKLDDEKDRKTWKPMSKVKKAVGKWKCQVLLKKQRNLQTALIDDDSTFDEEGHIV